jgi:hypothetical protein
VAKRFVPNALAWDEAEPRQRLGDPPSHKASAVAKAMADKTAGTATRSTTNPRRRIPLAGLLPGSGLLPVQTMTCVKAPGRFLSYAGG